MNKIFQLLLIIIFFSGCSLNKNSKFWTSETVKKIEEQKFEKIFDDPKALSQELNNNISLNFYDENSNIINQTPHCKFKIQNHKK